jgi:predicted alpha/beta-hydrolase family hydrolase
MKPNKEIQKPEQGANEKSITIQVDQTQSVSGLLQDVSDAECGYVIAHGAGAGMRHPFLTEVSKGLVRRQISSLRYQFLYMERGSNRPDTPKVAHAAVRAAVEAAGSLLPGIPLFAGGKSFGGRMTSQAQAESPLPDVRGLIFLGFPLHPPGRPSIERADHLREVRIPMLFLQGDRDEFAELALLQSVIKQLGERAALKLFPGANHSFHVGARTGRNDSDIRTEMLETIKEWTGRVLG